MDRNEILMGLADLVRSRATGDLAPQHAERDCAVLQGAIDAIQGASLFERAALRRLDVKAGDVVVMKLPEGAGNFSGLATGLETLIREMGIKLLVAFGDTEIGDPASPLAHLAAAGLTDATLEGLRYYLRARDTLAPEAVPLQALRVLTPLLNDIGDAIKAP